MGIEAILFYFFATILVLASTAVITVRNPVHAVLFLVLAFFTSAAICLCRRGDGVVPVRGDDVGHQSGPLARRLY
jgi:hypothetical protein